jgi:hypothetical protein
MTITTRERSSSPIHISRLFRLDEEPGKTAGSTEAAPAGATSDTGSTRRTTSATDAADSRARFTSDSGAGYRAYQLQQQVPSRDPSAPADGEKGVGRLEERKIDFGEVPQVEHTARPAQPVGSEAEEWNAVTGYIAGEATTNMSSEQVENLRSLNSPWRLGSGKPAAYAQWIERVGPGRPWDHKGAIQNAYGLSTPIPGKEGEIGWDVWSNIHYGIVGAHAKFSGTELHAGADAADLATGRGTSEGDQLAIQIGIELYEKHGKNVTADQIRQAVIDNYDKFGEAGKIYGDPKYLPEGWKSPYSKDG